MTFTGRKAFKPYKLKGKYSEERLATWELTLAGMYYLDIGCRRINYHGHGRFVPNVNAMRRCEDSLTVAEMETLLRLMYTFQGKAIARGMEERFQRIPIPRIGYFRFNYYTLALEQAGLLEVRRFLTRDTVLTVVAAAKELYRKMDNEERERYYNNMVIEQNRVKTFKGSKVIHRGFK
jgi:hypothetical protein